MAANTACVPVTVPVRHGTVLNTAACYNPRIDHIKAILIEELAGDIFFSFPNVFKLGLPSVTCLSYMLAMYMHVAHVQVTRKQLFRCNVH